MVFRGHVRNGRIELEGEVQLPEGASVDVLVSERRGEEEGRTLPTLYEQLKDVIGTVPDLPEDLSVNHDHYLYGAPKRE